jgi:hypothetical protein
VKNKEKVYIFLFLILFLAVGIYEKGFTLGISGVAGVVIIGGTTWIIFCSLMRVFEGAKLPHSFWAAGFSIMSAASVLLVITRNENTIFKYIMAMTVPGIILGVSSYIVGRNKRC